LFHLPMLLQCHHWLFSQTSRQTRPRLRLATTMARSKPGNHTTTQCQPPALAPTAFPADSPTKAAVFMREDAVPPDNTNSPTPCPLGHERQVSHCFLWIYSCFWLMARHACANTIWGKEQTNNMNDHHYYCSYLLQ
jgi:hypothetical protein